MQDRIAALVLRLIWLPVSGLFLFYLLGRIATDINSIAYHLTEESLNIWLKFDDREWLVFSTFLLVISVYLILEIVAFSRPTVGRSKVLKHLRWGPAAIWILGSVILILFDLGMIEHSKYKIRSYIFDGGSNVYPPKIDLHNNYRHWCGNGASAQENMLYFETAASGQSHEDPYVRSRSLLMMNDVQDWLNGGDERFRKAVVVACSDRDPIVNSTVEELLERSDSSCQGRLAGLR